MYTSLALLALAGLQVTPTPLPGPSWAVDYWQAQERGEKEGRPLAVFVGSGPAGYKQLVPGGRMNGRVHRLLADNYVSVYLDTDSREGRQLAQDLGVRRSTGLVISDRTGRHQAFHHDGMLSEDELEQRLTRYADPDRVVHTTETNRIQRTSYYPPVYSAPAISAPLWIGGGAGC